MIAPLLSGRRTAVLALLGALLLGCGAPPTELVAGPRREPSASPSAATPPAERPRYVGVVVVPEAVDVSAPLTGPLAAVHVHPGDEVEQGQLIAEIDAEAVERQRGVVRAELEAQRVALSTARLDVEETEHELEIARNLAASGHETETAVSSLRFALRRAQAEQARVRKAVRVHEAKLAALDRQRELARVRAPFDGEIALRYRDTGAYVEEGAVLVRLISTATPGVRFAVPTARADRISVGDRFEVDVGEPAVRVRAEVTQIAPEVDTAAQQIFVAAQLQLSTEQRAAVRSGSPAWVMAPAEAEPSTLEER